MQIASLVLIDSFLHKSKHSYADHIQPFLYTVLLTENGSMPAHRGHIAILTLCNCYRCSYTGNLDTSVSGRFTERFLHLFFRFIRHIDQSKPIEHPVDVSHSPDIAQSFRSFNYFS